MQSDHLVFRYIRCGLRRKFFFALEQLGIVKYSTAGIDDISEHICRRLLCRSFFLCRSSGSVAAVVVSAAVVVASVVVVVVVVVVAFVVVVVSVAVVVVTTVVVVVTVLSFFWLLVVWLPAVVNASSPQTRKMPAVIAVARLRYFGSSSLSSFSKSRFAGMKMNAAAAKQRKPLKVWAKIAITASTAETAKAISETSYSPSLLLPPQ